jgi:uncharacterized membrane-anchored protein
MRPNYRAPNRTAPVTKKSEPHDYLKYSQLVAPTLIILGVARDVLYYREFNVNILGFLEFTEIITSFLEVILAAIIALCLGILLRLFRDDDLTAKFESQYWSDTYKTKKFSSRLWIFIRTHTLLMLALIIVIEIMFFVMQLVRANTIAENYLLAPALVIGFLILIFTHYEVQVQHRRKKTSKAFRQITDFVSLLIFMLILVMMQATFEVRSVKINKKYEGVSIIRTDSSKYVSDASFYYIGKTKEYIFFHNEKTNTTEVIPASDVKNLFFPKSKN